MRLADRTVEGICFTVNRQSVQYSGDLSLAAMAELIETGVGSSGSSYDYLIDAMTHLNAIGLEDAKLKSLMQIVEARRGGDGL